ncbi:MAG TPA: BamA/TamA family outer membrane protein, partial [Nitrosopumilaceae archaeon]|nr:BamA/TamA family outer membrane protein [Nitrosopumilaceae archaeon]
MHWKPYIVLLLTFFLQTAYSHIEPADTVKTDTLKKIKHKSKSYAVPIIFFSPETKWAIGGAGNFAMNLHHPSKTGRLSNVQFAFNYSQLKQSLIAIPFQLWFYGDKYNIYGETNLYNYNFLYFGIGNHQDKNYQETYELYFPRIRLNLLHRMANNLFGGLRYGLDDFHMINLQQNGQLNSGTVTGGKGGRTSGIGLVAKYDNRDKLFYPGKGYLVELFVQNDSKYSGSNFNFTKYSLDASTYLTLAKNHIMAFNAFTSIIGGEAPFFGMSLLGGPKRMRGFYEGRYRDNNAWVLQAEYRVLIYKRFGAVVFSGIGSVSDNMKDYINPYVRLTYGAGARYIFDPAQHF